VNIPNRKQTATILEYLFDIVTLLMEDFSNT